MKDGPWWQLDAGRINDLQQDSIVALVKRCRAAHFVDVHVRINGKWEVHQADWIKHMKPRKRPVLAWRRDLAWRFRCRWSHLWRRAWAFTRYSTDYSEQEALAKAERLGVHARGCQPAWEYRKDRLQ